jgi:uracil-DNA glycosylase
VTYPTLPILLEKVRACEVCKDHLTLGCRPIIQVGTDARILIIGQAPGARVHASGTPWDDASGERLRSWMGINQETFYDETKIAIIPMGFCYPGRGRGGDLPPRKECAELWLEQLLSALPNIELTLLIGQYAQRHFLKHLRKPTLTETVRHWQDYVPDYLPLPHPSPRNIPWFQRHSWFEQDLLPVIRSRVRSIINSPLNAK